MFKIAILHFDCQVSFKFPYPPNQKVDKKVDKNGKITHWNSVGKKLGNFMQELGLRMSLATGGTSGEWRNPVQDWRNLLVLKALRGSTPLFLN